MEKAGFYGATSLPFSILAYFSPCPPCPPWLIFLPMRWIIGDVHGMLKPLGALVGHVRTTDPDAQLLFTGDYVNRGPDTRGTIDYLLSLTNARFIRGNHDDVLDLILSGRCYADNDAGGKPAVAVDWFLDHGLRQTLMSYGMSEGSLLAVKRDPDHGVSLIRQVIPPQHATFLHDLRPAIEEEDFFVVHAYWYPADPSPRQPIGVRLAGSPKYRRDVTWARFTGSEIETEKTWPRTGYVGHTPTYNYEALLHAPFAPIVGKRLVLLDTAAANDPRGRLTAWCHETGTYVQADREGKIIA
jgi:serine/threonine protein phosphatase 1